MSGFAWCSSLRSAKPPRVMMALAKAALVLALGIGVGEWEPRITAHYAPGVMERVVRVRLRQGYNLPPSPCYIASPTIPIGARVQVRGLNTGKTIMCYVADTSKPEHRAGHIRRGLIEVGYPETEAICGSYSLPNRGCRSLIRRLR